MSQEIAVQPLDPEPWVTVEPTVRRLNGGTYQRTTGERFSHHAPGRVFFPFYGYAQSESDYPASVTEH